MVMNSTNLVLFYVKLPIALNEKDLFNHAGWETVPPLIAQLLANRDFSKVEQPLIQQCESYFVKLGDGAFLIEEDSCYPAILAMIRFCNESRLQYIVVPVSDAPASVPPNYPEPTAWLSARDKHPRLTAFLAK